jgi:hypothetical protein
MGARMVFAGRLWLMDFVCHVFAFGEVGAAVAIDDAEELGEFAGLGFWIGRGFEEAQFEEAFGGFKKLGIVRAAFVDRDSSGRLLRGSIVLLGG